ncbi:unnamed protein product [Amoebophrya sp. A120]|nr:unnamed protein product [Amoebophrya sp. A120]|eukprot:GSA120T00004515001.1
MTAGGGAGNLLVTVLFSDPSGRPPPPSVPPGDDPHPPGPPGGITDPSADTDKKFSLAWFLFFWLKYEWPQPPKFELWWPPNPVLPDDPTPPGPHDGPKPPSPVKPPRPGPGDDVPEPPDEEEEDAKSLQPHPGLILPLPGATLAEGTSAAEAGAAKNYRYLAKEFRVQPPHALPGTAPPKWTEGLPATSAVFFLTGYLTPFGEQDLLGDNLREKQEACRETNIQVSGLPEKLRFPGSADICNNEQVSMGELPKDEPAGAVFTHAGKTGSQNERRLQIRNGFRARQKEQVVGTAEGVDGQPPEQDAGRIMKPGRLLVDLTGVQGGETEQKKLAASIFPFLRIDLHRCVEELQKGTLEGITMPEIFVLVDTREVAHVINLAIFAGHTSKGAEADGEQVIPDPEDDVLKWAGAKESEITNILENVIAWQLKYGDTIVLTVLFFEVAPPLGPDAPPLPAGGGPLGPGPGPPTWPPAPQPDDPDVPPDEPPKEEGTLAWFLWVWLRYDVRWKWEFKPAKDQPKDPGTWPPTLPDDIGDKMPEHRGFILPLHGSTLALGVDTTFRYLPSCLRVLEPDAYLRLYPNNKPPAFPNNEVSVEKLAVFFLMGYVMPLGHQSGGVKERKEWEIASLQTKRGICETPPKSRTGEDPPARDRPPKICGVSPAIFQGQTDHYEMSEKTIAGYFVRQKTEDKFPPRMLMDFTEAAGAPATPTGTTSSGSQSSRARVSVQTEIGVADLLPFLRGDLEDAQVVESRLPQILILVDTQAEALKVATALVGKKLPPNGVQGGGEWKTITYGEPDSGGGEPSEGDVKYVVLWELIIKRNENTMKVLVLFGDRPDTDHPETPPGSKPHAIADLLEKEKDSDPPPEVDPPDPAPDPPAPPSRARLSWFLYFWLQGGISFKLKPRPKRDPLQLVQPWKKINKYASPTRANGFILPFTTSRLGRSSSGKEYDILHGQFRATLPQGLVHRNNPAEVGGSFGGLQEWLAVVFFMGYLSPQPGHKYANSFQDWVKKTLSTKLLTCAKTPGTASPSAPSDEELPRSFFCEFSKMIKAIWDRAGCTERDNCPPDIEQFVQQTELQRNFIAAWENGQIARYKFRMHMQTGARVLHYPSHPGVKPEDQKHLVSRVLLDFSDTPPDAAAKPWKSFFQLLETEILEAEDQHAALVDAATKAAATSSAGQPPQPDPDEEARTREQARIRPDIFVLVDDAEVANRVTASLPYLDHVGDFTVKARPSTSSSSFTKVRNLLARRFESKKNGEAVLTVLYGAPPGEEGETEVVPGARSPWERDVDAEQEESEGSLAWFLKIWLEYGDVTEVGGDMARETSPEGDWFQPGIAYQREKGLLLPFQKSQLAQLGDPRRVVTETQEHQIWPYNFLPKEYQVENKHGAARVGREFRRFQSAPTMPLTVTAFLTGFLRSVPSVEAAVDEATSSRIPGRPIVFAGQQARLTFYKEQSRQDITAEPPQQVKVQEARLLLDLTGLDGDEALSSVVHSVISILHNPPQSSATTGGVVLTDAFLKHRGNKGSQRVSLFVVADSEKILFAVGKALIRQQEEQAAHFDVVSYEKLPEKFPMSFDAEGDSTATTGAGAEALATGADGEGERLFESEVWTLGCKNGNSFADRENVQCDQVDAAGKRVENNLWSTLRLFLFQQQVDHWNVQESAEEIKNRQPPALATLPEWFKLWLDYQVGGGPLGGKPGDDADPRKNFGPDDDPIPKPDPVILPDPHDIIDPDLLIRCELFFGEKDIALARRIKMERGSSARTPFPGTTMEPYYENCHSVLEELKKKYAEQLNARTDDEKARVGRQVERARDRAKLMVSKEEIAALLDGQGPSSFLQRQEDAFQGPQNCCCYHYFLEQDPEKPPHEESLMYQLQGGPGENVASSSTSEEHPSGGALPPRRSSSAQISRLQCPSSNMLVVEDLGFRPGAADRLWQRSYPTATWSRIPLVSNALLPEIVIEQDDQQQGKNASTPSVPAATFRNVSSLIRNEGEFDFMCFKVTPPLHAQEAAAAAAAEESERIRNSGNEAKASSSRGMKKTDVDAEKQAALALLPAPPSCLDMVPFARVEFIEQEMLIEKRREALKKERERLDPRFSAEERIKRIKTPEDVKAFLQWSAAETTGKTLNFDEPLDRGRRATTGPGSEETSRGNKEKRKSTGKNRRSRKRRRRGDKKKKSRRAGSSDSGETGTTGVV